MSKHYQTILTHPYSLEAFQPYQEHKKDAMVWESQCDKQRK
jgi:hypothetical protein